MAAILAIASTTTGLALADTIVKSFSSDQAIETGGVVALVKTDPNKVELAPAKDVSRIYGVVVEPGSATAVLERDKPTVYVATSGVYPVTVSTYNGPIKSGDWLSLSDIDGVAAKATDIQQYIVGKAVSDYNGASGTTTTINGKSVGKINGEINAGKNPLAKSDPSVPGPLLKVAEALAGKQVSASRIYSALGIFAITIIIAASLIVVGIRSSMISIGRNPLSKHSIMQGLFQVIVAAGLVFTSGVAGIFLLLKI